jgi:branched-chain amino acid transport system ATP-binding protein
MSLGLSRADRAYVLDHGCIVLSGTAEELNGDPRVVRAYLGR